MIEKCLQSLGNGGNGKAVNLDQKPRESKSKHAASFFLSTSKERCAEMQCAMITHVDFLSCN